MTREEILSILNEFATEGIIDERCFEDVANTIIVLQMPIVSVILPFDSINFKIAWQKWVQYRKEEKRLKYKSPKTEQAALKNLEKLSNGNEAIAIEIIDVSIANQYQGLFALKMSAVNKYQNEKGDKPLWRR